MHAIMMTLARAMALLGGLVLTFLILMTCVSVAGREINSLVQSGWFSGAFPGIRDWVVGIGIGPVTGDFELVEAGMAFAIFAFLPICQLTQGHATVDIFTEKLSPRAMRVLQLVIDVIFAAVLILIALRLYDGMLSKQRYGETTYLIQFPIWWAYAASLVGSVLAALVAVYVALLRLGEMLSGRALLPAGEGAEH